MVGNVGTALDAVDGMPPHGDLGGGGRCRTASAHQPIRPERNPEVIFVPGLVVDDRNGAGRAGAERVLVGAISETSGAYDDVLGGRVRRALDQVKRAGV